MTRAEHNDLGKKYRVLAIQAISLFRETLDFKYWEDYKLNSRLANKHYGIAQAMFTRKHGRI